MIKKSSEICVVKNSDFGAPMTSFFQFQTLLKICPVIADKYGTRRSHDKPGKLNENPDVKAIRVMIDIKRSRVHQFRE